MQKSNSNQRDHEEMMQCPSDLTMGILPVEDGAAHVDLEVGTASGFDAEARFFIDVDDLVVESKPPANVRGNLRESRQEQDIADQISEMTDDVSAYDFNGSASNGKEEVPLSHYPDMDDASRPLVAAAASAPTRRSVESQVSHWMATIPEPIVLRSPPTRRQGSPGAFAVTHRSASTEPDDQTVGTVEILSSPEEGTHQAECDLVSMPRPHREEAMLVQATLVEDGDAVDPSMWVGPDFSEASASSNDRDREVPTNTIALVEAKPLERTPLTFRESIRSRWTQFNILLTILLVSVAIALGVLVLQRPADGQNATLSPLTVSPARPPIAPSFSPTPGSGTNTTNLNHTQSEPPIEPTAQPTNAPTMTPITKDDLYALLPEYTKEAMTWNESPQFQAFEWLWGDPNLLTYSFDRMIQRFALKTVLSAVGFNFMERSDMYGVHECDWKSFTIRCDNEMRLYSVHLGRTDLQGTLPMELGLLTSLQKIDMSQNALTKTIPTTIGLIEGLQAMNFGGNSLSGSLPFSLASMRELRELVLNDNVFMSTIPADVGWMTHLKQLRLSNNLFTGRIPDTLRHLTDLEGLLLDHNQLSGSLPATLGDLSASIEMLLNSNKFSGAIPESLGGLSNVVLLSVADNALTGTVPTSLGGLGSVRRVELQGNSIQGHLPQEVCALKDHSYLTDVLVDCGEIECDCSCNCDHR